MRVLHVVHRVVVVFGDRQIDVEGVFGIGLATQQEETHRVFAGPLDQVTQGDVATRTLRNFDFFTTAHHTYHGVQHVIGIALWNTHVSRLQSSAYTRDGAVVVAALDIHHPRKATLPFGNVVSHIWHKVGKSAIRFAHDAVFVVAVVGRLQPQGAILLVGFARSLQTRDRVGHFAVGVEAGLEVVVVELDLEGFQI